MIYRLLFIFFLFPSFISVSHSSDDPWLIIEKAAKATKFLNYKGVFRSQHNKEIKSIEITHATNNEQEFVRMNFSGRPI